MTINTNLLICPAIFQECLVDKLGIPMSAGTITCYQDTNRSLLKNWYYQIGTPGNYSYLALPNPLTLSAAGTVCDISGNDVIPFFYPYNESDSSEQQPYYVTIVNYAQTSQITRSNFPFLASSGTTATNEATYENYIINNVFWRNIGTTDLQTVTQLVVAPSQHDGFQYPDIQFMKNTGGATETVSFPTFLQNSPPALQNDPTPEYYLKHVCTGAGSGESYKYYQFPLSYHLYTANELTCVFTMQGVDNLAANTTLSLYVLQDLGSGSTSDAEFVDNINLTSSWTKFSVPFTLPSTVGKTLSATNDNALYLQIRLPNNATFNISFTKPSLYLGTAAPTNNFSTYDQIDAVIGTPRTGDIRMSLNSFSPYGWVAANDGCLSLSSNNSPDCYGASTINLAGYVYVNSSAGVGATLTAGSNGAFVQDGVTVPQGSRWLYKNDTTGAGVYNGIYILTVAGDGSTAAVLTRATDFDTPAKINSYGMVKILNGTANTNTYWIESNTIVTIGTTALAFAQSLGTARSNSDTWQLYNLLWNSVSRTYAPISGGEGTSAYDDFVANKLMILTKTLSRLLGSSGQGIGLTNWALGQNNGSENVTLTENNLPAHSHTINTSTSNGIGLNVQLGNNTFFDTRTTGSTGSGTAFSILPPAVYYNVFFKL